MIFYSSHIRAYLYEGDTMPRTASLTIVLLVFSLSAFASDPPGNTGNAKPPAWAPPGIEWFDSQAVIPDPHAKAHPLIKGGYGSSILHSEFRPGRRPGPDTSSEPVMKDASGGWPRTVYSWFYTTTDYGETEPTIVSNNLGGVTYHAAGFHRPANYNGYFDNWLHANYTTNIGSFGFSASAPTLLYVPAGYHSSGDPWLSANSFDDGVAPRRMYMSGINFNRDANGNGVSPSAIRVWYSDNGGQTWSGGWPVDSRGAGQPILDRPTSAVSEYSGTRGYYYVAYTEFSNPMRLWITSSTNGVRPFCNAVQPIHCIPPQLTTTAVSDREGPFGPAIVINPNTGRLYVFWWTQLTPFGNAAIRMRRSADWKVTNFEVDGSGNPIEYTIANGYTSAGYLPNGVRAFTELSAKYNSATGRVDLAWHGSNAGSNGTAIYYMSFDPDTVTTFNTPMSYARIDAPGDQYEPALDSDDSGWTFVSYLTNQNSVNAQGQSDNFRYQHYGFVVAPWGGIYPPYALENGTHFPFWPGDYYGNYLWTSLDGDGARWNVVQSISNPDGSPMDIRWTGVK
jgi:hypothetical protein